MNNNFNQNGYNQNNGQFGGWGNNAPYMPYGNGVPYGNRGYQQPINNEKRKDKKILRKMGSAFGLCIIAYVLLSFLIMVLLDDSTIDLIYTDSAANYAFTVIGSVVYVGVPFAFAYMFLKKQKIAGILPFGTAYNGKAAAYLVLLFIPVMIFSSMAVNFVSVIIQSALGITFTSGLEDLTVDGVKEFIIAVISMAIVPAIIEEFAVRGVVLQPLRRYGDRFAIIASAFVFSIMHGNMVQMPYTLVGGILLGYLTVATGSIWPSIIVHFVNNMYSVIVLAATSSFGERASVIVVMILFAAFIAMGIIGGIGFFSMNYKTKLAKGVDTLNSGEKASALFVNIPMIIAIIMMLAITVTNIE